MSAAPLEDGIRGDFGQCCHDPRPRLCILNDQRRQLQATVDQQLGVRSHRLLDPRDLTLDALALALARPHACGLDVLSAHVAEAAVHAESATRLGAYERARLAQALVVAAGAGRRECFINPASLPLVRNDLRQLRPLRAAAAAVPGQGRGRGRRRCSEGEEHRRGRSGAGAKPWRGCRSADRRSRTLAAVLEPVPCHPRAAGTRRAPLLHGRAALRHDVHALHHGRVAGGRCAHALHSKRAAGSRGGHALHRRRRVTGSRALQRGVSGRTLHRGRISHVLPRNDVACAGHTPIGHHLRSAARRHSHVVHHGHEAAGRRGHVLR
mmetsp:Transcript_63431/g.182592  ORF Transcript_63431/g.182592 Transcript_63431/m.182592 type:complete len:323 (-) Transcript_63431:279-1247(-)